jgi:pSer/pThr/pTyr-binding forkhead associated (FHA) protein
VPSPPPAVPDPPPLPPPVPHQALEGVSGTQVISAAEARAAGLAPEQMTLIVGGTRVPLTKRVSTMGRSRDCDVVVPDPNASRIHAEIRHIGLDYFLVDMGSTNGTEVNGEVVRRHALADGDRIVVGTTEIVVELR